MVSLGACFVVSSSYTFSTVVLYIGGTGGVTGGVTGVGLASLLLEQEESMNHNETQKRTKTLFSFTSEVFRYSSKLIGLTGAKIKILFRNA